MADETFSLGFDPGSLQALTNLMGFQALLDPHITDALTQAGKLLTTTAQTNAWSVFEHPTGQLADSITFYVASPSEVDVQVGVPYGRRQEYGGGGLLDSLGRRMTNPAKPYLQPAIDTDSAMVQMLVGNAVLDAWETA